jgi:esterase
MPIGLFDVIGRVDQPQGSSDITAERDRPMRLSVIEQHPPSGEEHGPPVVFLHGLFGRARNMGFLQRQVSAERRTLALDLRSHGASPHARLDYPSMAADVLETLTAHNALPAVLIGHSMGGKTAMLVALNHPDKVAGLLVADISPVGRPREHQELVDSLRALQFPPHLDVRGANALLSTIIPEKALRDLMVQNIRVGDSPGWQIGLNEIAASLDAIYGWPSNTEGLVYEGPTLFIRGGNSRYIRPEHLPIIARFFPHYRLETIEGAGHWVHAEKPKEFAALMLDFLKTI